LVHVLKSVVTTSRRPPKKRPEILFRHSEFQADRQEHCFPVRGGAASLVDAARGVNPTQFERADDVPVDFSGFEPQNPSAGSANTGTADPMKRRTSVSSSTLRATWSNSRRRHRSRFQNDIEAPDSQLRNEFAWHSRLWKVVIQIVVRFPHRGIAGRLHQTEQTDGCN